jgi:hypothetical protein
MHIKHRAGSDYYRAHAVELKQEEKILSSKSINMRRLNTPYFLVQPRKLFIYKMTGHSLLRLMLTCSFCPPTVYFFPIFLFCNFSKLNYSIIYRNIGFVTDYCPSKGKKHGETHRQRYNKCLLTSFQRDFQQFPTM